MSHAKKSSNPDEFILPDLGEGVAEAELIRWRVREGQAVKEHDVLADMETDKALVEVPSPRDGVIAKLHGSEGQIIKVGAVLVTFQGSGVPASSGQTSPTPPTPAASPAVSKAPSKPARSTPELKSPATTGCDLGAQIAAAAEGSSNGTAEPREDAGTVVGAVGGALAGLSSTPGKALATPAVRRLARDLGVDIDSVHGTGIGGRVLEKDVREAAAASASARSTGTPPARVAPSTLAPTRPAPPAVAAPAPRPAVRTAEPSTPATAGAPGETTRIPFRGVRRTIGARLRESIDSAVHFTVMDEADVTALDALRRKLAAASGERVSFLPFVASAVCRALTGEFGALNSTSDLRRGEDGALEGEIIRHRAVHLGVATDTENGLMVPVVRDCDKLGVLEISRHITHAAEAARSRTAPREMLSGSTFTISNVGSHAGRFATPVINYPEVAILAVGRARDGVVVRGGGIGVGRLLPLSLACDHRIVDGAQAALCLARIVSLLQDDPESLLGPARG
jgi:pyruvate dehydrogenase E2 component (dihydrolipoamide acetyltransferase)